jgi:hypothetical protein
MLRRSFLPLFASVSFLALTSGCDLLDQELEIPLDLESPPQDFDLAPPVAEAEATACSAADSPSCIALSAICATEANRDCNPATMPDEFPAEVEVIAGEDPIDSNQLMADIGITEATEIELGVPVDATEELREKGVASPDLIQSVSIDAISLVWSENALTFDAPPLDLYVSGDDLGGGVLDAEQLIASGAVTKVGTIGIDLDDDGVFDIGQAAGATGDVPMEFDANGKDALNAAVKSGRFTIVTAVPEGRGVTLKTKAGDPSTVLKPTGSGTVALKATLVYKVKASDVVPVN